MGKQLRALAAPQIAGMLYSALFLENLLVQEMTNRMGEQQEIRLASPTAGMGHLTGMAASVMIVLVYAVELACKYVAEEQGGGGVSGHNTKQIYAMIGHEEQKRIEGRYGEAVAQADSQMGGWDGPTKPDIQKCIDEQRTIHLTLRKLGRMNVDWRYAAEQPGMFTVGTAPFGAMIGWCKSDTFGRTWDLMSTGLLRRAGLAILSRDRVPSPPLDLEDPTHRRAGRDQRLGRRRRALAGVHPSA